MRVWAGIALASILAGCTGSDCPEPFIQVGKVCKCPEETELLRGTCVAPDAGEDALRHDAEAVEGTADGGMDDSSTVDADAGTTGYPDSMLQDAPQDGASQQADVGSGEQVDASTMVRCYVDRDKDGVGAGAAVDCANTALVEGLGHKLANLGGDCDDNDAQRSPSLSDVCGDTIDNDCDDKVDDESNNACGGACSTPLAHQPGEPCNNGALGACLRSGVYECRSGNVACTAASVSAGSESCGDRIDNDCDGLIDEPDATNAPPWYQDCDGDGFAASTKGAIRSCSKPEPIGGCTWSVVEPNEETKSNWDCNDSSPAYSPSAAYGFPPAGYASYDLNCDGSATLSPTFDPSTERCSLSVADFYNGKISACPFTGLRGCLLWKDSQGLYRTTPTQGCPDTPWVVRFDQGWEVCSVLEGKQPVWPCR